MTGSNILSTLFALALSAAATLAGEGGESAIYWVSAPVQPGEVVMVCGYFPQPDALAVAVERLDDQSPANPPDAPWLPSEPSRLAATVKPLQASETVVMFELPAHYQPGVFSFSILTKSTAPNSSRLNRPTLWWALGDLVTSETPFGKWPLEDAATYAGGSLRIVGRCLQLGRSKPSVALRSEDGHVVLLQPAKADPYALVVRVPEGLPTGRYELFVHNGYGGRQGWSEALNLAILKWEEPEEILINAADFGANGDDDGDDTRAINSALQEAAKRGGAAVLVPRGRFVVSEKLVIPPYVTLRGAGRELTALCMADTDAPPSAWVEGSHHFAIEDLTLYCNHHIHVISNTEAAVHGATAAFEDPETAGHVRLTRVRVRADSFRGHLKKDQVDERTYILGPRDTVRLTGPDIRITDCDMYGSNRSIYLHQVVGAQVERNIFYNGRSGWMNFNGCENIIFEGNRLVGADLMASGGGYACFSRGISRNIYTARNSYENLNGWDREAFTSDAGGGAYFGGVAASAADYIVLAADPKWQGRDWTNTLVAILAGRGRGQFRFVRSWDGRRVQLDRPFEIPPDETSRITVTMSHYRYIFYDNEFRDAGIAIQFYGTAAEHIVAKNRTWRTDGYRAYGFSYTGGVQPNYFLQFLGNEILEGNCYRYDNPLVYPSHLSVEGTLPSLHFGSVMRNNHLYNNARIEVVVGADSEGATENVLVEGNTVEHSDLGILVDKGTRGVLLRRNRLESCSIPLSDGGANTWLHPGEKLAYQVAATGPHLDDPRTLAQLQSLAAELRAMPNSSALASQYEEGLAALWQAATRQQSAVRRELLEALLGLSYEVAADSALARLVRDGRAGEGALQIQLRTQPWSPEIAVRAQALPVPDWEPPSAGPELALAPDQPILARVPLRVPQQTTRKRLPFQVTATYRGASLATEGSVDLERWRPSQWAIIGPFPNASAKAADPYLHAPERWLDLNQTYAGIQGTIRWREVHSSTLDFAALLRPDQAATAYAVAVLRTTEPTNIQLQVSCGGHVRLWLGDDELGECAAAPDAREEATFPVQLEQGNNLLLAKTSFLSGPWDLHLEIEEGMTSEHRLVQALAAPELWQLAALVPPPQPPAPPPGPLEHGAGVHWKQVYADDFDAQQLMRAWRVADGRWEVSQGVLVGGGQSFILLRHGIEAPVRIEYDTRAQSPHDLSALWSPDPDNYFAGYLIAFAQRSTGSRIEYPGAGAVYTDTPLAQGVPNQWHHVIAQVLADGKAQLVVDGQLLLEFGEAPKPTVAGYAGLWTWHGGEFDNVRIYSGE